MNDTQLWGALGAIVLVGAVWLTVVGYEERHPAAVYCGHNICLTEAEWQDGLKQMCGMVNTSNNVLGAFIGIGACQIARGDYAAAHGGRQP